MRQPLTIESLMNRFPYIYQPDLDYIEREFLHRSTKCADTSSSELDMVVSAKARYGAGIELRNE